MTVRPIQQLWWYRWTRFNFSIHHFTPASPSTFSSQSALHPLVEPPLVSLSVTYTTMHPTAFVPSFLISQRPQHSAFPQTCPAENTLFALNRPSTSMVATPTKERVTRKQTAPSPVREPKQPDMYRLYIYNDPFNKRERVVDVLLKTCQGLSFSRAYAAMQEAHETGRGLVLIICQEIAEHYCASINMGRLMLRPSACFLLSVAFVVVCRLGCF